MANDGHSSPSLTNCTFADNHATAMYGALYSGTGPTNVPNAPSGRELHLLGQHGRAPGRRRSATGTTAAPPSRSRACRAAGRARATSTPTRCSWTREHGDYRLGPGSPCVDTAHGSFAPPTDRDGHPRYEDAGCPSGIYARVPYFPPGAPLPEPKADAAFPPAADMGCFERREDSLDPDVPEVVFVDAANTAGPWDGRSWATAFADLQEALRVAYKGSAEVWVAAGVYPTTRTARPPRLVPPQGWPRAVRRVPGHRDPSRRARLDRQRDGAERRPGEPAG